MGHGVVTALHPQRSDGRFAVKRQVGYLQRHNRVRDVHGFAACYPCVDCALPATDWSQQHGTDGQGPDDYVPRCRSCHARYDKNHFPNGEAHPNAKLSDSEVRSIRERRSRGEAADVLASEFGVTAKYVRSLANGQYRGGAEW